MKAFRLFTRILFPLTLAVTLLLPHNARADRASVTAAFDAGDTAKAIELLKPMAQDGDKWAQALLAGYYVDRANESQTDQEMKNYLALAKPYAEGAAGTNPDSDFLLAMMLMQDAVKPADARRAGKLLKRWIDDGNASIEVEFGYAFWLTYFQDDLRPDLWPEAKSHAVKAAAQGYVPAMRLMGSLESAPVTANLLNNDPVALERAMRNASHWYYLTTVKTRRVSDAESYLQFVRRDASPETVAALTRLADEGCPPCQGELANRYLTGALLTEQPGSYPDAKKAESYASKAAANGDGQGNYVLGKMYMDGYLPQSTPKAIRYFEASVAAGYRDAYEQLHYIYARGINIPSNQSTARQWLERGARDAQAAGKTYDVRHFEYLLEEHDRQVVAESRPDRFPYGKGSSMTDAELRSRFILGIIGAAVASTAYVYATHDGSKAGTDGGSHTSPSKPIWSDQDYADGIDAVGKQNRADFDELQRTQRCGVGFNC